MATAMCDFTNSERPSLSISYVTDEEMITKYGDYAWHYARKQQFRFRLSEEDVEDIVAECNIKLVKMPQHYRRYFKVIMTSIHNMTRDWLEKHIKPRSRMISDGTAIGYAVSNGSGAGHGGQEGGEGSSRDLTIADLLPDTRPSFSQTLLETDFMTKFWSYTEGVEQLLIVLRLGLDGHKQRSFLAVGRQCGLSAEKAEMIYQNAMDRIRSSALVTPNSPSPVPLAMNTSDYGKMERLAVAGKTADEASRALGLDSPAELSLLIRSMYGVADWDAVREIACHRKARRLMTVTEIA